MADKKIMKFEDYVAIIDDGEKFKALPSCRIHIPGESLWGKKLPDGNVILNNTPLSSDYRWCDVVSVDDEIGYEVTGVVFRYFLSKAWFKYTPVEGGDEKKREQRRTIFNALKTVGWVSFFTDGIGCVELRELGGEEERLTKALATINITPTEVEVEGNTLHTLHPQTPKEA